MSSGSGKKKVVAAAASPLSVSITPNPVPSSLPTGGIKLFIDKNRIFNIASAKSQPSLQRQPVFGAQTVSLNDSNADILTNGSYASSSFSVTTAPARQNIVKKNLALSTGTDTQGKGGDIDSGEMRVKVTGEDRNGQSMVTGGQLGGVKQYNSLLIRRPSTTRRLPVSTTSEADGINGQRAVPSFATITLSDGNSLNHRVASTTNLMNTQPAKTISVTAKIPKATSTIFVPISNAESHSLSKNCTSGAGLQGAHSDSNMQSISVQETELYKDDSTKLDAGNVMGSKRNIANVSSAEKNIASNVISTATSPGQLQTGSNNEHSAVATTSGITTSQDGNLKAVTMVTAEAGENNGPTRLCIVKPVLNDCTGMDEAITGKVTGEEVISKPSREIKSLQRMQSASKILTEFIAETSSKGKLRKRPSDSAADVEAASVDSSAPASTTLSAIRKRPRRQSTIYRNSLDGKELATESSYRLDEMASGLPASRGRKGRSAANKLEFSQQKNTSERNEGFSSTKEGCKDFFSSLNLGYEHNKTNEPLFPGDPPKPGWDRFCWRCKKSDPNLGCSRCIRSYHDFCVRYSVVDPDWTCIECKTTLNVHADVESMSKCLGYVLDIIQRHTEWNEPFNPIDTSVMPHYDKYITRHMDLSVLNKNLAQRAYKTPEAFLADMSWIGHNMSIYPDKLLQLKLARAMQKKAKHEIEEIEPCHECYIHANTKPDHWFKEPCSKPHLLVWAKLKGYPYWPGKLYAISGSNQAYVRFFATHDRSWLPVKDCYLYCQQDPNPSKNLKSKIMASLANSVKDIEQHITRLREQFTIFNYGPFMELVDPSRLEEQQRAMLPGAFLKKVKVTIKRSDGEMVAVASPSNDGEADTLPKKSVRLEVEKTVTPTSKEPAKKDTIISPPRKRLTRRMSRFMRTEEESAAQLINAECSQEVTNEPNASVTPNNDKALECNQLSDRTNDDKMENSKGSDCNPKNLSLLLRRGSQSWETGPFSKRRKSTIDKAILSSAASKTNAIATCTNVKEAVTNVNKNVDEPIAGKQPVVTPMDDKVEATTLTSGIPEAKSTTTTCSKVKETQITRQTEAAKPVVANVSVEKHTPPVTKKVKEAPMPIQTKVTVPVPVKTTFVPVNAPPVVVPVETHPPPATNTLTSITSSSIEQTAKQAVTPVPDVSKSVANSSSIVTMSKAQKYADSIESVASGDGASISKTLNSTIPSKDNYTKSTDTNQSSSIDGVNIKQEIIPVDEGRNTANMIKDVLPSPKELVQKDNSTSLDAGKVQTISAVSSANVVKPVQQTPSEVPVTGAVGKAGDSHNTPVSVGPSKQRARKSFPGGAGANATKHVISKQAASLVPSVLLAAGTSRHSNSATVSIPKELVTPSEETSLLPAVDNRIDVCAVSSVANDSDDVMIIEEPDTPTPSPVPSRERKKDENYQLPPLLVPKPPERISSPNDISIDLNNSMQIFDDSSNRVLDYIRMVMEDMLKEMSGRGSLLAEMATLKLSQERQNELRMQEKQALQQEYDRKMADLRISLGQEKDRALRKQRQQLVVEKERAVNDAKMKQWCKKCFNEASYYCCWNTSYCSEKCQQKHWLEHKQTHSASVRAPVQPSLSTSNLIVSHQLDNGVAFRSGSSLNIAFGSSIANNNTSYTNTRSPNNRVVQNEIIPTSSTPLQAPPVRFLPSTIAGNVGFKTPVIQSVHGRDSIVIKMSQNSAQNGSNATSTPNMVQQQLQQQKKFTPRDKSVQLTNHQKAVSPNKVYIPKKTYDITSSPYQSTSPLTSTTSAIAPMVTSSVYATVTPSDEVAGSSHVSSSAWNQMSTLHPTANRQLHTGIVLNTALGRDGTEKGQRHCQPIVASIVPQTKTVQPSSTTYMRNQQ